MRLANFKIRSRLGFGFSLVVIMSAIIGFIALRNFDILWAQTDSLYKHPLVVSKANRDIRTDIMASTQGKGTTITLTFPNPNKINNQTPR